MKILLVLPSLDPADGGPPESMRTLCRSFVARGHAVEIATLDDPRAPWLSDVPCPVTAHGPGALKYRYAPRYRRWLAGRASSFDVVVVNGLWQYHAYATWRTLRRSTTPYVVFTHGMLDPWFRRRYPLKHVKKWLYWPWADYRVLRDARRVFFTTDEERRLARQSFSLYRANEAVVGYGTAAPPDATLAQRNAFFDRFPDLRDKRLFLFLSRIHPKKGCDLLIEAFARVVGAVPGAHLVMAGPDSTGWQRDLEIMASARGLERAITWTGMLSGDVKWGAYRAAEAFVLPSHSENFGIVVVEALACGTPVLISNRVNIWREVHAAGAGLIADDTLDGAVGLLERWLALNGERRERMRDSARQLFARQFEINAVAEVILDATARSLAPTSAA